MLGSMSFGPLKLPQPLGRGSDTQTRQGSGVVFREPADDRFSYERPRPTDEVGTPRLAGLGSEGTSCANIRCVCSVSSAVSSRRRKFAITSSRITATSTNSGLALSSRSASAATTPPSGWSSCTASTPISAWMGGRSIRGIRCIGRGEAGPAETQLGPSTEAASRAGGSASAPSSHHASEPGKTPG